MTTQKHIPVLINEVLAYLSPKPGGVVLDGTFGAGGYSRAFLEKGCHVIALDRDPQAIKDGQALKACFAEQLELYHTEFSQLGEFANRQIETIVLDIGVSSMQIDEAERGFSFQKDGPLDMRMAQAGLSASDVVNNMAAKDLARIFYLLGEERHAGRIARMIEEKRTAKPFLTTLELADRVEALIGRKPGSHIHPATRIFQALRIYVNDELGQLAKALFAAEAILPPNGRLGVVTFHSLEDRMVKRFFASREAKKMPSRHLPLPSQQAASFQPLFKGAKSASDSEILQNPRARSAKLRVGVRTDSQAFSPDFDIFSLPRLSAMEVVP